MKYKLYLTLSEQVIIIGGLLYLYSLSFSLIVLMSSEYAFLKDKKYMNIRTEKTGFILIPNTCRWIRHILQSNNAWGVYGIGTFLLSL